VSLGEGQGEDVGPTEGIHDIPGELGGRVDLGRPGCDPLADDGPDKLAELPLPRGEEIVAHEESLPRA
jgi:hypothetical protein